MNLLDMMPLDIRESVRAVLWNRVLRDGRWTKVPFQVRQPARKAAVNNPATWAPFMEAVAAYEDGKCDGVGIVLGEGLIGVDLDHCRDAETGVIEPWAQKIIDELDSYTEISPSGTGVHILLGGAAAMSGRRKGPIEIYADGRYFTMTGDHLPGTPTTIEKRSLELAALVAKVFGQPGSQFHGNGHGPRPATADDDQALLEHAFAARNGQHLRALYEGNWSSYPSQSEADLALCNALAALTASDTSHMDRLFRRSGLYRQKWDERRGPETYGERTIDAAIAGCREGYSERAQHGGETRSSEAPRANGASDPVTSSDPEVAASGAANTVGPEIDAGDLELCRVTDRALNAMRLGNQPPELFLYGGLPVRLEQADGTPTVRPLTEDRLRHHLARYARWVKIGSKGERRPALPPMHVVRDILAHPAPPFPPLDRIVEVPVFDRAGRIHLHRGYDGASRLFYAPAADFEVPSITAHPSHREIKWARALWLSELMGDFPFISDAERAHALGLGLLPFLRDLINGPTPLHLVEKPSPGTGAGLLVDMLFWPALGREVGVMVEGRDEDEWRKRVTAKLSTSPVAIQLDNLRRRLDSAAVSAAITAMLWEDRVLGSTATVRLPVRCVWVATANNPTLSNEIARRTVRIRLDAKVDRPWLRERFRHPDLRAWARQHRADLVWAALTLGQAWMAAGRPLAAVTMGQFEEWARTVGGVLQVAEVPGFLTNLDEFYAASDVEAAAWRVLVSTWRARFGESPVGVAQLWSLLTPAEGADPIDLDLGDGTDRALRTRFGKRMASMRDRVFGEVRILAAGKAEGANLWRLAPVEYLNV